MDIQTERGTGDGSADGGADGGASGSTATGRTTGGAAPPLLVGFDGSRAAAAAVRVAASLWPAATARMVHVWAPPGRDPALRQRVTRSARTLDELSALIEHECAAAAGQVVDDGATLARAAGWAVDPVPHRAYGDAGMVLAHLAAEHGAAVLVLGSRGLTGTSAVLGSVSDLAVHHSPVPVLVVPPLLTRERADAATGPVLIAHDGSAGADHAQAAAAALLPDRVLVRAHVAVDGAEPSPDLAADQPGSPTGITVRAHGRGPRAIADALEAVAADHDAGILVVGSRGRSTLREVVLGSTAMAVLHHVHRPVLVVPAGRSATAGSRH